MKRNVHTHRQRQAKQSNAKPSVEPIFIRDSFYHFLWLKCLCECVIVCANVFLGLFVVAAIVLLTSLNVTQAKVVWAMKSLTRNENLENRIMEKLSSDFDEFRLEAETKTKNKKKM